MNFFSKYKDALVLALILLLAAVLRFYGYASWSLSNDELSAITRLEFDSFGALIAEGVRPDFHPAGVQVFLYYWTALFGNDVWAVRLPFVLFGIASVYYCYLIAKRWFNVNVAQLSALTLACLSYPILYSQLARPYSPGLFFSLALVYYWSCFIFGNDKSKKNLSAIAFFMAACMYTHYFSFFFAALVGATGIIFLRRENYLTYFVTCGIAVLLFMPHIGITLEQFSRGGVGTWLGPPESDYLRHYLYYAFNESVLFIIGFFVLFILSILTNVHSIRRSKYRLICLLWFFISFAFGYYYSIYRNPILQYSVLLFSFSFLVIYLHSFYCDKRTNFRCVLLFILATGIIFSAAKEQHFFKQRPFSEFRNLAMKKLEWDKQYGKSIPTVYNVIAPSYIDYYFEKAGEKPRWTWVRGDDSVVLRKFYQILDTCRSDKFIYGWGNTAAPFEIYELIKSEFPYVLSDHIYFNSRITVFSKAEMGYKRPLLFRSDMWTEKDSSHWTFDRNKKDTLRAIYFTETPDTVIDIRMPVNAGTEYSPGFSQQFYKLTSDSVYYLNIYADISSQEMLDLELVLELREHLTDNVYEWRSVKMSNALSCTKTSCQLLLTTKIPKGKKPEDKIKVYLWNHSKKPYYIRNMSVSSFADMDYTPVQDVKELMKLKSAQK